jgi:hypothetical protein
MSAPETYEFDASILSDVELQEIIDRPVPAWWQRLKDWLLHIAAMREGCDEIDRIIRFLESSPAARNDEFIQWLLLMPYVEPTVHEGACVDYREGWQTDPEWWARVVDWDVR